VFAKSVAVSVALCQNWALFLVESSTVFAKSVAVSVALCNTVENDFFGFSGKVATSDIWWTNQ